MVREHYEFVWHVAHRVLGNAEDAADVSQDVFLRLLLHPPAAEAVASPKAYLAWRVVGRASTLRRSAERRRERERASLERLSRGGLETDDLDALRAALEALPFELRQVIELRYLAEMPAREIAEVLSISERAVRLRAEKAREALKGRLAPMVCGVLVAGGPLIVGAVPPPPAGLLDGLLRISRMAVPLGTQTAAPGASAGLHWTTGAFIMSTKNLCIGAILSVLLLCGLVSFLPLAEERRAAKGPPVGAPAGAVDPAARLPGSTVGSDAAFPAVGGAQPGSDSIEAEAIQPVSLEGRVTESSGEPIAGARVMAVHRKAWELALGGDTGESAGGPLRVVQTIREKSQRAASTVPRAVTDAEGTYAFRGLRPGEYHVLAAHPEHLPRRDAWAVVEAVGRARADIVLEPARMLAGKVVDDRGEPVAGAIVRSRATASGAAKGMGKLMAAILESTDGSFLLDTEPARTDAAGRFRIGGLEPVLQDIVAVEERRGRGESRGIAPGNVDCVVALSRGVEVSGRVLTPAGGPIEGAQVTIGEPEKSLTFLNDESLASAEVDLLGEKTRQGATDEHGRFRIPVFERGDLEIRTRAPRHLDRADAVRVEDRRVDAGDLILLESSSIHGIVIGPDGAPVEGARVSALENRKGPSALASVETDSRGRFVIEGLSPGPHALEARAVGLPAAVLPAVESGGDAIGIRLESGLTVTGVVVDEEDRVPVAGAGVSDADGRASAVLTDEKGRFALVGVGAAPAALHVSNEGHSTWRGQAGPEPVEVLLRRARGIHGVVLGPDSKPLGNVRVAIEPPGIPPAFRRVVQHFKAHLRVAPTLSAEDGSFFIRIDDWDQPCLVVASAPGYATSRVGPLEPPGQREEWPRVEVRLSVGASIAGRVSRSDGTSLPGARVLLRSALELSPEARAMLDIAPIAVGECVFSGADGGFLIERIEEGLYEVEVSAVGCARKTMESFAVGKEPARLDVVLDDGGSIDGKVVDHRGVPLAGIEVVALLANGAMDDGDDGARGGSSSIRRFGIGGGMGVASMRSDASGVFRFERLPEGAFHIVARAPGFEPAAIGPVEAGERADLMLLALARLSGEVLDAETRLPVPAFGLKLVRAGALDEELLERAGRLALDESRGTFLYAELPAGDYILFLHADGYVPFRGALKLEPGKDGSVTVVLDHGLRVSGVVRSSSTRTPIAGAEITAVPGIEEEVRGRSRARSDDEGRFLLQGLAAGDYELVAAHPDFVPCREDENRKLTLPLDEERDLAVQLDPAGRLEGRVTNLPPLVGEAPDECHFLLLTRLPERDPRDEAASTDHRERCRWILRLDSSGHYGAVSLRPGTYRLELVDPGSREGNLSPKMVLAGEPSATPGKLLGETEVRAGETARLDAAVR